MKILILFSILALTCIQCSPGGEGVDSSLSIASMECGSMSPSACETFRLVNLERINQGLQPLSPNEDCIEASQYHAEDMEIRNYFSHDSPEETWSQRLDRFGVSGAKAENIAWNSSPAGAVDAWMNSIGHRNNILNSNMQSGGIGVAGEYYVQCFSSSE